MENVNPERTILYAPGLRQPVRKVNSFFTELAEYGVKVIAPEQKNVFSQKGLDSDFRDRLEEWPYIQLAKANNLYRTISDSGVERVDVVGYCEGGVTGTILASVHPEVVEQLVLVNPAGMTKEHGPDRLTDRFKNKNRRYMKAIMDDIITGSVERSTYRMAWSNVNRILGMRALSSLSEVYMPDTLKSLADDGMKISIIHGYKDRLYPYADVSANVPDGVHAYASFADRSAGHAVFETHSRDATESVIKLLDL